MLNALSSPPAAARAPSKAAASARRSLQHRPGGHKRQAKDSRHPDVTPEAAESVNDVPRISVYMKTTGFTAHAAAPGALKKGHAEDNGRKAA